MRGGRRGGARPRKRAQGVCFYSSALQSEDHSEAKQAKQRRREGATALAKQQRFF